MDPIRLLQQMRDQFLIEWFPRTEPCIVSRVHQIYKRVVREKGWILLQNKRHQLVHIFNVIRRIGGHHADNGFHA